MTGSGTALADAVLDLLLPIWQVTIGCCVLAALVVSVARLSRRGPTRMGRALVVTGVAVLGVAAVGILLQIR
jgi:hypothetical protein